MTKPPRYGYAKCSICGESFQVSLGRGIRAHEREAHYDFWRWRRRWIAIVLPVLTLILVSLFPLLAYGIIPARQAMSETFVGVGLWAAAMFSFLAITALHSTRVAHTFRDEWRDAHPLYHREYGNLRGMRVSIRPRWGGFGKASIVLTIIHPLSIIIDATLILFGRKQLGNVKLDRYEDGELWFYDAFDVLTSIRLSDTYPPDVLDDRRVRVKATKGVKGLVDISAQSPSEFSTLLSVLRS